MTSSVTDVTKRARGDWSGEQVALIKATVANGLSDPELGMFLELSARYQLDPFAGQIFAIKMSGRNGGRGQVKTIVPRDGFLVIASRNQNFDGIEGDVVHENDEFWKKGVEVQHTYQAKDRGEIIGAWALVWRTDRQRPTYFFAKFDEYNAPNKDPWKRYPSAMILKVAEVNALKKAFNITGLISEEESHTVVPAQGTSTEAVEDTIAWGDDPATEARLKGLFEELNQVKPNSYRPAKIKAELAGLDDESRLSYARHLEEAVVELGGTIPDPPDMPEVDDDVIDAEVVSEQDDGEPATPAAG